MGLAKALWEMEGEVLSVKTFLGTQGNRGWVGGRNDRGEGIQTPSRHQNLGKALIETNGQQTTH